MKINLKNKTSVGKRMWGVANLPDGEPACIRADKEQALRALDSDFKYLVELTVTKVYEPAKDLANFNVLEEATVIE